MRVAMIGQKGIPARYGGVETHVHELSVGLVRRGIDVTAYSRAWYTQITPSSSDGVSIVYRPSIRTKHLDTATHTLFSTIDAIRKKFDIVHYHGVGPSLFAWMPRVFAPKMRVVATFHTIDRKNTKWGFIARMFLRIGEWAACRFAHKTIAVSQTLHQYIRDVYDIDAAYIPNSVHIRDKVETTNRIAQWGLTSQGYILMVARLIALKGAHELIEAYKSLKREHPELVKGKKLVIVGDAVCTSDYVSRLKAQAADDADIIFTGFQTGASLAELYSHAFTLVHPSHYEGLSLTVLEGMSYGLPLVVSDIPEHRILVPDSDRRFSCGDVDSMSLRLAQLLETSASALCKEGAAHKRLIQEHFHCDRSVEQVQHVYEQLVDNMAVNKRLVAA